MYRITAAKLRCQSSTCALAPMLIRKTTLQEMEDKYCALEKQLRRIHCLGEGNASYASLLDSVTAQLSTVNTSSAAYALLLRLKASSTIDRRRGRIIKVQPTSLARRRPGLPRGAKRVPAGRPAKAGADPRAKRRHSLSMSISRNVPGAKGH